MGALNFDPNPDGTVKKRVLSRERSWLGNLIRHQKKPIFQYSIVLINEFAESIILEELK